MSNNKQTAVEWLVGKLKNMKIGNNQLLIYCENLDYLFQQAKEMEKQQIMDAFNNGENRSAELYYNEEYGKQ